MKRVEEEKNINENEAKSSTFFLHNARNFSGCFLFILAFLITLISKSCLIVKKLTAIFFELIKISFFKHIKAVDRKT